MGFPRQFPQLSGSRVSFNAGSLAFRVEFRRKPNSTDWAMRIS
jgi:hypothetical protein